MNDPTANAAERAPNSRQTLDDLLDVMIQHPERRGECMARIERDFEQELAPLILDMSGFTRTTHQHGIVAFLLMIRQMHQVCCPAVAENGGKVVKTEADNLFCVFPDVAGAVAAARDINQRLDAANLQLPAERQLYASIGIGWGRILNIDEHDLFGDEVNLACKLGEDIAERRQVLLTERARECLPHSEAVHEQELSISGLSLRYFELEH